jgi:hypothetical protein
VFCIQIGAEHQPARAALGRIGDLDVEGNRLAVRLEGERRSVDGQLHRSALNRFLRDGDRRPGKRRNGKGERKGDGCNACVHG